MKYFGFLIIILYLTDRGSTDFTKGDDEKLKQFIQELMNCRRVPGKITDIFIVILINVDLLCKKFSLEQTPWF